MTLADLIFTATSGSLVLTSQNYSDAANPLLTGPHPDTLWGETNPFIRIVGNGWITANNDTINGTNITGLRQGAIEFIANGESSSKTYFIVFRATALDLTTLPNSGSNNCYYFQTGSGQNTIRSRKSGTNTLIQQNAWGSGSANHWFKWRIEFWVNNSLLWLQVFRYDDAGAVLSGDPVTDNTNDFDTAGVQTALMMNGGTHYVEGWKGFRRPT